VKAKSIASGRGEDSLLTVKVEDVKMEESERAVGVLEDGVPPAGQQGVHRRSRGRVQAVKVQAVVKKKSRSQDFVELMRAEATLVPSIGDSRGR